MLLSVAGQATRAIAVISLFAWLACNRAVETVRNDVRIRALRRHTTKTDSREDVRRLLHLTGQPQLLCHCVRVFETRSLAQ